MKIKYCFWTAILVAVAISPAYSACVEGVLQDYLKNPTRATAPYAALRNCEFALVTITAMHPDRRPEGHWKETGTLNLKLIEDPGKRLPKTFSVRYYLREARVDCETWDFVVPKPGGRLLAFFRPAGKGWTIPELTADGIVNNVDTMNPGLRKSVQKLFKTRL